MIKQLQQAQEKLRAIDRLTNCLQKINEAGKKDDIAYLIHKIIEAEYLSSGLAREVLHYQLESNKDIFMSA